MSLNLVPIYDINYNLHGFLSIKVCINSSKVRGIKLMFFLYREQLRIFSLRMSHKVSMRDTACASV